MSGLDSFVAGFCEEPGYLDYARVGPLSAAVTAEANGQVDLLSRARFGSLDHLAEQDGRARSAVATATGFRADQVVLAPSTTAGLMQAVFGLTGELLLSPGDFPSLPFAAARAAEALHVVTPRWLTTALGRVTPGEILKQLTPATKAVAVCLVDARTGYRADLDGIRQVIGDRLLIVDAVQGLGVVDAAFEAADVVASGGQTWLRAGSGTGFLALSDRALERLTPVFSGFAGTDDALPWDDILPPSHGANAFRVSASDPLAAARLAASLEELNAAGIAAVSAAVADNVSTLIDLADDYAVPVVSSRDDRERAGILVLEPPVESLTRLSASLHNHGVSATQQAGGIRLSVHAKLSADTIDMIRGAFTSYSGAARY